MSNPGVIYLAEKKLDGRKDFRIEDNIGEAIHIHYREFRMDLTVSEFFEVSDNIIDSLNKLIKVNNFDATNFDPIFLDMCSNYLLDLIEIEYTTIKLEDLKVQTLGWLGIPVIKNLKHSRVLKALKGNCEEQIRYKQENYRGQNNIDRMNSILDSIKNNGYPHNDSYIVLFNNQNFIRDGQHRAACIYYLYGNIEIPIIRMHFKDGKYNSTNYPWLYHLFVWNKKRLINSARSLKKMLKRIKIKAIWKLSELFMRKG